MKSLENDNGVKAPAAFSGAFLVEHYMSENQDSCSCSRSE
jgi:hypothetical protein